MLQHIGSTLQLVGRLQQAIDVSRYTPSYFRAHIPELAELDVGDEAIARSSVALLDFIEQKSLCGPCQSYDRCGKHGDAKGMTDVLHVHDDEIVVHACACHRFREWTESRRLEQWQTYAGSRPAGRFDFGNFPQEQRKRFPGLFEAARSFAETYTVGQPSKGLYIFGPPGVGKTHLMLAIIHRLEERKVPLLFVRAEVLFDKLRSLIAAGRDIEPYIDAYCQVPILAIDEFAQERTNEFTMEKVFRIINARFAAQLPTLFTSNYEPPAIYARASRDLAQLIDPLRSRILQMNRHGRLDGDDARLRNLDMLDT